MNIHDLTMQPIERVECTSDDVARRLSGLRKPLIISGLHSDFEFFKQWDFDFFTNYSASITVQKPEEDGVNYFFQYFQLQFAEFVRRLGKGEKLYIGAQEILGQGGHRSDKNGLGELAEYLKVPKWFDHKRIWSANLWMGAGNNRTLLHYDPWDTLLMLADGEKKFVIFPDSESPNMYQFSAFNFKALFQGKVIHSKIRPLNVQTRYRKKFSRAKGFEGTLQAGEAMFVPAGFWHYVESSGLNIGVNFFLHSEEENIHLREPLRTYWIKDNVTLMPIRLYYNAREFAAKCWHSLRRPSSGNSRCL